MADLLFDWFGFECYQMVRLFFSIWPFEKMKISPIMSRICQIRNKLSKICLILRNFCQSGEILPTLVTLNSLRLTLSFISFFSESFGVGKWTPEIIQLLLVTLTIGGQYYKRSTLVIDDKACPRNFFLIFCMAWGLTWNAWRKPDLFILSELVLLNYR